MRIVPLTGDAGVACLCGGLTGTGTTTVQRLTCFDELSAFPPDFLGGLLLLLERGDETLSLTLSIRVAQYRPGMSVREFVNQGDNALHDAKAGGRNCVAAIGPAAE